MPIMHSISENILILKISLFYFKGSIQTELQKVCPLVLRLGVPLGTSLSNPEELRILLFERHSWRA